MSYLTVHNVSKSYGGIHKAVDDVSFRVEKGEFLTFLGPNGSGKTTTLMMIAGFEEPTSGTIELDGQDITNVKPYRRNVGMVFQNCTLFPHMTVAQNIAFPLRMRHYSKELMKERVAEILDLVGLSAHAGKHPKELSGGQQ